MTGCRTLRGVVNMQTHPADCSNAHIHFTFGWRRIFTKPKPTLQQRDSGTHFSCGTTNRAWSVDFSWCFQPSRVYIDVNLGCVVGVPGQVPKCGRAALVWTCFTCCRLEHGQVQMNLLRLFCTACYAADTPFLSCMLSVVVNLCSERNVPHSSNMEF